LLFGLVVLGKKSHLQLVLVLVLPNMKQLKKLWALKEQQGLLCLSILSPHIGVGK